MNNEHKWYGTSANRMKCTKLIQPHSTSLYRIDTKLKDHIWAVVSLMMVTMMFAKKKKKKKWRLLKILFHSHRNHSLCTNIVANDSIEVNNTRTNSFSINWLWKCDHFNWTKEQNKLPLNTSIPIIHTLIFPRNDSLSASFQHRNRHCMLQEFFPLFSCFMECGLKTKETYWPFSNDFALFYPISVGYFHSFVVVVVPFYIIWKLNPFDFEMCVWIDSDKFTWIF